MSSTGATNYINSIDVTYPLPGQDNNSQGFRSNFNNIYQALNAFDNYMGQLAATSLSVNAPFVTATFTLSTLGDLRFDNGLITISTSRNVLTGDIAPVVFSGNAAGSVATYANSFQGFVQSVVGNQATFAGLEGKILVNSTFTDSESNIYTVQSVSSTFNSNTATITANATIAYPWTNGSPVVFNNPTFGSNINHTVNSAINTAFTNQMPLGSIIMFGLAASQIPAGWAICNGQTVNGITTPDLTGSFILGANADSSSVVPFVYNVGSSGSNIPVDSRGGTPDSIVTQHSHGITDPGHHHSYVEITGALQFSGTTINMPYQQTPAITGDAFTGVSVNSTGTSGTLMNLPPYVALYYIMKVANFVYNGVN